MRVTFETGAEMRVCVHVKCSILWSVLTGTGMCSQRCVTLFNSKVHYYTLGGSSDVTCGETDGHGKDNRHIFVHLFCQHVKNNGTRMELNIYLNHYRKKRLIETRMGKYYCLGRKYSDMISEGKTTSSRI